MFSHSQRLLTSLALLVVSALATPPIAEASAPGAPLYTAQRKPRVAVMVFRDTNTDAGQERFGPSVSAMLVTHLKRHSQFVVVERQDLDDLLDEWSRTQGGKTTLSQDLADVELLERIDVILKGEVTVLEGGRIEIDAKLLSRLDGRIVTAAQRSGPETCLRQVVERLGIALEQDFLRPYYGKLRISFHEPENTHFYLTPVLGVDALDEEKPPVELGLTVEAGEESDRKEPWITNPTTYTAEKILSGWYTVRLERPGYAGIRADAERYQAVAGRGKTHVCWWTDKDRCVPAEQAGQEVDRFLVHIEPLQTVDLDATAQGFSMRKERGSIQLTVFDEKSRPLPDARVLLRSLDLQINPGSPDPAVVERWPDLAGHSGSWLASWIDPEAEVAAEREAASKNANRGNGGAQQSCNFFERDEPPYIEYSDRLVRSGSGFDISTFKGGLLGFEDYRGEDLPSGLYEMVVRAPYYQPAHRILNVADGDGEGTPKEIRLDERQTRSVRAFGRHEGTVQLAGELSDVPLRIDMNVPAGEKKVRLPVDRYIASMEASAQEQGQFRWEHRLDLMPPSLDILSLEDFLEMPPNSDAWRKADLAPDELPIKDGLWVGGRLEGFLRVPGVYYDSSVGDRLDEILDVSNIHRQVVRMSGGHSDLELLEERLAYIDLLILDEEDVRRLRVLPEVAEMIRGYLSRGHALMAFVAAQGDYSGLFGAPLKIGRKLSYRQRLKLYPGEVRGVFPKQKIDLSWRRLLPRLKERRRTEQRWRVVGKGKKSKDPRILERDVGSAGGYVMVWLESTRAHVQHLAQEDFIQPELEEMANLSGSGRAKPLLTKLESMDEKGRPTKKERALDEKQREAQEADERLFLLRAMVENRALAKAEASLVQRREREEDLCPAATASSLARR